MNRRSFNLGAVAAAIATSASSATAQVAFSEPGKGPWPGGGFLQRAGGRLNHVTLGAAPYIQTLSETAALIGGALEELGIEKADLLGTSLDACVSLPIAAYFPERVRSLALESCALGLVNAAAISAQQNASRRRAGHCIQPSERGVAITDIKAMLTRVKWRTLLLYGDRPNSSLRYREGAEAALAHSQTRFVVNSGAFVMPDNPAGTAKALKRFLEVGGPG